MIYGSNFGVVIHHRFGCGRLLGLLNSLRLLRAGNDPHQDRPLDGFGAALGLRCSSSQWSPVRIFPDGAGRDRKQSVRPLRLESTEVEKRIQFRAVR